MGVHRLTTLIKEIGNKPVNIKEECIKYQK
jgi:hypothetical protein